MVYIGKSVDRLLHLHSNSKAFITAKELRQRQTFAEKKLWSEIRNSKCNGLKFRRQHPILSFIADFYCHDKKLIIEVDGSVHDNEETRDRDEIRTQVLEDHGIKVLRFTNEEIINDIGGVLMKIEEFINLIP